MTTFDSKCDVCDTRFVTTTLQWNSNLGWHGVCNDCRMVPVTGNGRFVFVRVGA
jgi:hypothetical protein